MLNNDFKDIMQGRKSVKVYDKTVKIPRDEMLMMLNEAITAPSAFNLQPWQFVVVDSEEGKETLKPFVQFNTTQAETSAAMVVIFGDTQAQKRTDLIYDRAVSEGKMPQEIRDKYVPVIKGKYDSLSQETMREVVKMDSSLFAMQFMLIARAHGYDTNPMTGFTTENLAETLGLAPERYVPVMMISIGKAEEAGRPSVRIPAEDITRFK